MSELRTKLLELAVKAGATIENATKVASDWEQWANDDDPLRLGVPPPASVKVSDRLLSIIEWVNTLDVDTFVTIGNDSGNRLETGSQVTVDDFARCLKTEDKLLDDSWVVEKAFRFNDADERIPIDVPKNLGNQEQEIDWSRPQLVIGINENYGQVVETNGVHGDWNFTGKLYHKGKDVGAANTNVWPKKHFEYHGEIPVEPKNLGETEPDWSRPQLVANNDGLVIRCSGSGVNSFGFWGVVVNPGVTSHKVGMANRWNPDVFHYHGEIPTEEPKTTGLNFVEALAIITENKELGMQRTPSSAVFVAREGRLLPLDVNRVGNHIEIFLDHFLATDWKIVTA